mmetsp:Transcript_134148/g.304209  ORF Transcript_134148/g.304209 Transcript_134148/m.304209 type:complete len:230 (+) Transcript_134148:68-757(+)
MGNVECCEKPPATDEGSEIGRKVNAVGVSSVVDGTRGVDPNNAVVLGDLQTDLVGSSGPPSGAAVDTKNCVTRKQQYGDGSVYEGQMIGPEPAWKRHGHGSLQIQQGTPGTYTGQWNDDVQHGQGVQSWDDGRVFEGTFLNGKFHGEGKMTWKTNDGYMSYEGQYIDDKKEGKGIFTWADGRTYTGQWLNGKRHGAGEYKTSNGTIKSGVWQEDKLMKWVTESPSRKEA